MRIHPMPCALLSALLFTSFIIVTATAQVPGTLDLSFNIAENSANAGLRALNIYDIVEQPDGKILVGGRFTSFDGKPANGLLRLNADFSVDQSFQIDESNSGEVLDIELMQDGRILIGGSFQAYGGSSRNYIARLLPNGLLDETFDTVGSFNGAVQTIVVQPDGKIAVGGRFNFFESTSVSYAARLNADGSLDPSFNAQGLFNSRVKSILLQNGKYIVAGWFTQCRGTASGYIVRLNADGSCDPTFSVGSGANNVIETITYDRQGRILVGGTFTTFNGITANRLTRLQADGTIDEPFQTSTLLNGEIYRMEVLADDSIIIVGGFNVYNGALVDFMARIDNNGTLDPFDNIGKGSTNKVFSMDVLANGNIAVGGEFYHFDGENANRLALLDSDGALVKSLQHQTGANNTVYALTLLPDGKMLVGGRFSHYNGSFVGKLTKLNQDGSRDNTFSIGEGFDDDVYGITVQTDGKILVAGGFTTYNTESHRRLVRLLPNGSLDPAFQIGTGFNLPVYETIAQPDGKILVAGFFTSFNGQPTGRIIRLNADGSRDNSFNIGTGFDNYARVLHRLTDGRILVGGAFTAYQNQPFARIVRLLADGSVDPSFNPGAGFDSEVRRIIEMGDGKLVIGGYFNTFNNLTRRGIVRLLPDGAIDNSFEVGTGFSGQVLELQSDSRERIVVVGSMTQYNGKSLANIARIQPDGSLDTEYFSGSSVGGSVHVIAIQPDDNVIFGGGFDRVGTHYRANIAKLLAGVPTSIDDDGIAPTLPTTFALHGNYPNPFNPTTTLRVELPEASNVAVTVYDLTGRIVMQLPARNLQAGRHNITLDASRLGSGVYLYRLSTGTWAASGKMTLVK
jgi:uncharacterized delta-60 repeat protein